MHKMYIKCLIISKLCTKNVYHFIVMYKKCLSFYTHFCVSFSHLLCSRFSFFIFPFHFFMFSSHLCSLLSIFIFPFSYFTFTSEFNTEKKETVTLSFKVR